MYTKRFMSSVALVLVWLIMACANAYLINKVQLGMTEDEVVSVLGPPDSRAAVGGSESIEYLTYMYAESDNAAYHGILTPYFVAIRGDSVVAFGRRGDFGSTIESDRHNRYEIQHTGDSNQNEGEDLYTELIKLQELLDKGIITQDEFDFKKSEILAKY